jgi:hypothetical protein
VRLAFILESIYAFAFVRRGKDFEEFGYQTRLACKDTASAIQICGLHIHSREDELLPEVSRLPSEIIEKPASWRCLARSSI